MAERAFRRHPFTLRTSPSWRWAALVLLSGQAGAVRADDPAPDIIKVRAEPPVVTVAPVPPGRHSLSLPTLQYAFEVGAECSGNDVPQSLSINIADTRVVLGSGALGDDARQVILLTVPASQIAPVAVEGFCELEAIGPDEAAAAIALDMTPVAADPYRITVSAALSAQVSLLCGNEDERQMTYLAQPLDITLACEAPVPGGVEQRQSEAATPR